jgi:hypothetical protein
MTNFTGQKLLENIPTGDPTQTKVAIPLEIPSTSNSRTRGLKSGASHAASPTAVTIPKKNPTPTRVPDLIPGAPSVTVNSTPPKVILSAEQKAVLERVREKQNAFFTGSAGTEYF